MRPRGRDYRSENGALRRAQEGPVGVEGGEGTRTRAFEGFLRGREGAGGLRGRWPGGAVAVALAGCRGYGGTSRSGLQHGRSSGGCCRRFFFSCTRSRSHI